MKWTLIYFDDQVQNIECFQELLGARFNVVGCDNSMAYQTVLADYYPHGILIDVHMPNLHGHELYKRISEHPLYNGCPIIFISGDQSDENKLKSYLEGGIDFLPRDLSPEEIVIRITNKIKYFQSTSNKIGLGNLEIDFEFMTATVSSALVELTILEFRLLSSVLRTYPDPISCADLKLKVWGDSVVRLGTISTHLSVLRSKIANWDHQIKLREEQITIKRNS